MAFKDIFRTTRKAQIPTNTPRKVQNYSQFNGVFYLNQNTPIWINTSNLVEIGRQFETNPVLYSVITTGANYIANGRVKLRDVSNGEIITQDNARFNTNLKNNQIIQKAFSLINNPNPLNSRWEFMQNYLVNKWLFGNAFIYANNSMMETNIKNVAALWNIWPQYMSVVLTGQYFSALNQEDIIKEWVWGTNAFNKNSAWKPSEILHRKDVNISISKQEDIIFGKSRIEALNKPLSNIKLAYESENNIMQARGARYIVSSGKDDSGTVPIQPKDKKRILDDLAKDYGLADGQSQAMVVTGLTNITPIDQDIRKLGIFETIATDSMAVSNAYHIPHDIIKYNLTGSTFDNQDAAEKRAYQNAVMPEYDDLINDLNDFLLMRDFGYEYIPDWSAVPILQEDIKEKALANRQISQYYKELFMANGCTLNEWRIAVGLNEETWGGKRMSEMDESEVSVILNRPIQAPIE